MKFFVGFRALSWAVPHRALSHHANWKHAWHTYLMQRRNWKNDSPATPKCLSLVFCIGGFWNTISTKPSINKTTPNRILTLSIVLNIYKKLHRDFLFASKRGVSLQYCFSIPLNMISNLLHTDIKLSLLIFGVHSRRYLNKTIILRQNNRLFGKHRFLSQTTWVHKDSELVP